MSACAHAPPAVGPAISGPIAFTAESRQDSLVNGTFEGTAIIHDGWIDVTVTKANLSFPAGSPARWRSLTLRAFLAADYGRGSWKAPVESRPSNLWRFLSFGSRDLPARTPMVITEPHRFVVPIPPGASLATARLALELEWVTLYKEAGREYGETESNYAFSSAPLTVPPPPSP